MKIRIYETDFEGTPIECTGDYFCGATPLEVVQQMQMNPFTASLEPAEFMRLVLDFNGQSAFELPSNPHSAALAFLQRLTAMGYARFELDAGELDVDHSTQDESGVFMKGMTLHKQ